MPEIAPTTPKSVFPDLGEAQAALARADAEFARRRGEYERYAEEYAKLRGSAAGGADLIRTLLRTYGPRAATYFGLPGGAAALTALTADPGAFAGLKGLVGKIAALFGLGG